MLNSKPRFVAVSALVVLLAIQFIPVARENPPIEADLQAPASVKRILETACYDCHSNETRWPWYGRVAPVSWVVSWDVSEAREEFNFSNWGNLGSEKQAEIREEIWEEVEEGEMPLWYYLPAHPEARLSDADRDVLHEWSLGVRAEG